MINKKVIKSCTVSFLVCLIFVSKYNFISDARTQDVIDLDIEENESNASTLEIKIDAIVEQIKGTHDVSTRAELTEKKQELDKELLEVNKKLNKLRKEVSTSDNDSGPDKVSDKPNESLSNDKNENLNDKDLVVSKPIIDSSKNSVRVTEIYSINNTIDDCYYRPKIDDVPLLANRILKVGKYAAAYTGFFNLDYSSASKPSGVTSRALEILGYDYLLSDESYDVDNNKYNRIVLSDDGISEETAIMDLYKALGLEMYDIKMYHKKAPYTSGNSPASTLLNRSTLVYSGGGDSSIKSVDSMESYETHVFVSRTNPILYMKKLSQDFNISVGSNKVSKLTNSDFIVLCAKMMQFYGEPEMSETEMNQLVQVYGSEIPTGMDDEIKTAWIYLKARGVLNVEKLDLYGYLDKDTMFDILMRIRDKDSRVNYKDIKVVLDLNSDIISKGYYPTAGLSVKEVSSKIISTEVDLEKSLYYDYLVPVNDYSKFKNQFGNSLSTMYISNNPTGIGTTVEGSSYAGVDNGLYYHYKIPINLNQEVLYNNKYIRIESPGASDKPAALYIEVGGGILRYDSTLKDSTGTVNVFKRRPFSETEYKNYVDENRYDSTKTFDWDSWNKNDGTNQSKPEDAANLGFEEWKGSALTQISDYTWAKDDTTGKWRCYKGSGYDKDYIQTGLYYLGKDNVTSNPQDNIYAFDGDGYMVTGWYKENNYWYYFTSSGNMTYSQKRVIDGVTYEFDQYGRWIDMKWNIPADSEDIWGSYNNISGTWQLDGGKWWYMLQGGDWLFGGIYKINDKFYSFDDNGYMNTGWIKDRDYWFYFDDTDGYMYINATTPDGSWCGANGRATGTWKLSVVTNKLFRMMSACIQPIVTYAKDFNLPNDSATLTTSGTRWYRHVIPMNMVKEEQSVVKTIVESSGGTLTTDGSNYVIRTRRSQANMLSRLTLNTDSGYELVVNSAGILNLTSDDKLLVPYSDLASAGLFTEVTIDKTGNKVKLSSGINRFKESSNKSTSEGFGEIVLDNNNHTILVGTTIYRVPSDTTLFTYLSDKDKSYTYIDSSGKEKTKEGEMLYIDFRAAFGWSSDMLSFYRDSSGQIITTVGLSSRKNSISTVSKDVLVSGGQKKLKAVTLNGYSRPLFLLSNSYPVANWAMLRVNKTDGTVTNKLVVSYYKKQFGSLQQPDDYQSLVNLLKTPNGTPNYTGYCYRLFDIDGGVANTLTDSTNIESGKFYMEKDFGLVYAAPTEKEWNENNGYDKYLKGEYPLPLTIGSMNSMWLEKSVPYIEGLPYGTTILKDKLVKEKIKPQIGALSYLLYDKNESGGSFGSTSINVEKTTSSNDLTSDTLVYFGQNRLYRLTDGSYIIDGLKYGNEFVKIDKKEYKDDPYIYVNRFFSNGYDSSNLIGSRSGGTSIYVSVPSEVEYTTVAEEQKEKKTINYSTIDLLNSYNNFAKYKVDNALKTIQSGTSLLILITIQVLPSILFVASCIVLLFSLLSDWKAIRMFCNRFIDPIKILTAGVKNIETAGGIWYTFTVLTTTIALALFANGNFLRVLAALLTFSGEVLNIINNM